MWRAWSTCAQQKQVRERAVAVACIVRSYKLATWLRAVDPHERLDADKLTSTTKMKLRIPARPLVVAMPNTSALETAGRYARPTGR